MFARSADPRQALTVYAAMEKRRSQNLDVDTKKPKFQVV